MWSLRVNRKAPMKRRYRYIIVGAGTAGCILANRLVSATSFSVLLLEAGSGDSKYSHFDPVIHVPTGYLIANGNPKYDWCLKTDPDPALGNRALNYARGKMLSGCSGINGMISNRGQRRDYDRWAERTGNKDWSWDNSLRLFKKSEKHWQGENELHGGAGEFPVEQATFRYPILDKIQEAFVAMGAQQTQDFNEGDFKRGVVGYYDVNQRRGVRATTAGCFLAPVIDKPNLEVVAGATVHQLRFKKVGLRTHVIGVSGYHAGGRVPFEVDLEEGGEVILCAGAIHSPALLQVSGVGPRDVLSELGITDPVKIIPGVGKGLEDHLQIRPVFKIRKPNKRLGAYSGSSCMTLNTLSRSRYGCARIGLDYLLRGSGPLSMAPSQLGAFIPSADYELYSNLQFHCQPLSLPRFGEPLHDFEGFTLSVCNLNPESKGSVRAVKKFLNQPDAVKITTNYISTPRDREIARLSVEAARRVVEQSSLKDLDIEEVTPGASIQNHEEVIAAAGKIATTIFHPACTLKMGGAFDDDEAVCDGKLRVKGIERLRVADCSVMPNITSGNTNTPVMMIAERCAEYVLEDKDRASFN